MHTDGLGYNFSAADNWINYSFNTSPLRIMNWTHGPRLTTLTSIGFLNVTSDNKTQIELVRFNISSTGTTTNLNISYYGRTKQFQGDLKTIYLEFDKFIHSGTLKDAVNLT